MSNLNSDDSLNSGTDNEHQAATKKYDSSLYAAEDAAIAMMESAARDAKRKREESLNFFLRTLRKS